MKEKKFEDMTKGQQEQVKELVIERIKKFPKNLRVCIG